jgi:hypothetical protein
MHRQGTPFHLPDVLSQHERGLFLLIIPDYDISTYLRHPQSCSIANARTGSCDKSNPSAKIHNLISFLKKNFFLIMELRMRALQTEAKLHVGYPILGGGQLWSLPFVIFSGIVSPMLILIGGHRGITGPQLQQSFQFDSFIEALPLDALSVASQ